MKEERKTPNLLAIALLLTCLIAMLGFILDLSSTRADDAPNRKIIFISGFNSYSRDDDEKAVSDWDTIRAKLLEASQQLGLEPNDFIYFSYDEWQEGPQWYHHPRYEEYHTCQDIPVMAGWLDLKIIQRFPDVEFNIIGHSLGGVIATYWAATKDPNDPEDLRDLQRVHSIITLDSPLRGFPLEQAQEICEIASENRFGECRACEQMVSGSDVINLLPGVTQKMALAPFCNANDCVVFPWLAGLDSSWVDTFCPYDFCQGPLWWPDPLRCREAHSCVKTDPEVAEQIKQLVLVEDPPYFNPVTPTPTPTNTPPPQPTETTQQTDTPVPTMTPTTGPPTYFVEGMVTGPAGEVDPISEVDVCAGGYCVRTDSGGHYRIEHLTAGTHTVTPGKEGLSFIPSSKDVTGPPDVRQINFVGVPAGRYFAVSGLVTGPEGGGHGISGVEVCVTGHYCVWTDDGGNYRIENIPAGAQVVIPTKDHFTFIPPTKEVIGPPDLDQVNFVGVPSDCCYTVSGYVSGPEGGSNTIPGVRVDIRGHGSSYTDHNGQYIIGGLDGGRYKVLPYDDRYDFGPVCKWVDIGSGQEHPNPNDVNFTAIPTGPPPGVTLYEHSNYEGIHETFIGDVPNLANTCFGDDLASSLKIVGSYTAILYEKINYQGDSEIVTADDPQIWDEGSLVGNDEVSSIRVLTPTPTPTNTPTSTPSSTATPTATATGTAMPTATHSPTPTSTPCILFGDLNGDGDVDIVDIMMVASHWNTSMGDPNYNPTCDLDSDGDIDITDIMLVAVHWGEACE